MAKNIFRSLLSLFLVTITVLALAGTRWWDAPPGPLAAYTAGGKIILLVLVACSAVGLWSLWAPSKRS